MTDVEIYTRDEVAAWLRCSPRKVSDTARKHGIGADLGGRAGWRFSEDDKQRLLAALRPARPKLRALDGVDMGRIRKGRRSA